jgi:hypothetical protein
LRRSREVRFVPLQATTGTARLPIGRQQTQHHIRGRRPLVRAYLPLQGREPFARSPRGLQPHATPDTKVGLRTVPTMACSLPVQAGALPGLSATDARGVAAAGDMKERAVSPFRSERCFRSERYFRSERAPLVRAKVALARGKGPVCAQPPLAADWRKDGVRQSFESQFRTQDLRTASQGAFPHLIVLGLSLPLRMCRSLCGRAF